MTIDRCLDTGRAVGADPYHGRVRGIPGRQRGSGSTPRKPYIRTAKKGFFGGGSEVPALDTATPKGRCSVRTGPSLKPPQRGYKAREAKRSSRHPWEGFSGTARKLQRPRTATTHGTGQPPRPRGEGRPRSWGHSRARCHPSTPRAALQQRWTTRERPVLTFLPFLPSSSMSPAAADPAPPGASPQRPCSPGLGARRGPATQSHWPVVTIARPAPAPSRGPARSRLSTTNNFSILPPSWAAASRRAPRPALRPED